MRNDKIKQLHSDPHPTFRDNVFVVLFPEPLLRSDDCFRTAVQPCAPPAEAAVCNYMMAASAHQRQVMCGRSRINIVNSKVRPAQVLPAPGRIVRKNEKF